MPHVKTLANGAINLVSHALWNDYLSKYPDKYQLVLPYNMTIVAPKKKPAIEFLEENEIPIPEPVKKDFPPLEQLAATARAEIEKFLSNSITDEDLEPKDKEIETEPVPTPKKRGRKPKEK
jgi:hypothetical protein